MRLRVAAPRRGGLEGKGGGLEGEGGGLEMVKAAALRADNQYVYCVSVLGDKPSIRLLCVCAQGQQCITFTLCSLSGTNKHITCINFLCSGTNNITFT